MGPLFGGLLSAVLFASGVPLTTLVPVGIGLLAACVLVAMVPSSTIRFWTATTIATAYGYGARLREKKNGL